MNNVAGVWAALDVQLTDEEAMELAVLAADGDQEARAQLTHSLMGLAFSIAGAYHRQNPAVDEGELTGEALEILLRYGIDGYDPDSGIPVRVWAALVIRRRLAKVVDKHLRDVDGLHRYAATVQPTDEELAQQQHTMDLDDMRADFRRLLEWNRKEGTLTDLQLDVVGMRSQNILFDEIGQRLGIHRKWAVKQYREALNALRLTHLIEEL